MRVAYFLLFLLGLLRAAEQLTPELADLVTDVLALARIEDAATSCDELPQGRAEQCNLLKSWKSEDPTQICVAWVDLTLLLPGNRDKQHMRTTLLDRCIIEIKPAIQRFQRREPINKELL